jgi:hypothetical protein
MPIVVTVSAAKPFARSNPDSLLLPQEYWRLIFDTSSFLK